MSHFFGNIRGCKLRCSYQIGPYHKLPKPKWAICTSATIMYATSALKAVGVPIPDAFVVSEDVEKGKPEYVPSR